MNKIQKIHHSISELGNLQARLITEYQDDNGNVIDKKYSDPYTPATFVERRVEDHLEVTDDNERHTSRRNRRTEHDRLG
jgi:hypothetical protein